MEGTLTSLQTAGLYIHYATDPLIFWVFCSAIAALLWWKRRYHESLVFAASLLLTTGAVAILKVVFAHERPLEALVVVDSYAFPSGHAASSTAVGLLLIWILWNTIRSVRMRVAYSVCIAACAGAISYSRVVIGVHTPSDVIAGMVLGAFIVGAAILVSRYTQHRIL